MSLTSGKNILWEAAKCGYAVGGFDVFNMETAQAVIAAAEESDSPVFLQSCLVSLKYSGVEYAIALLQEAARQSRVPVCLHVDHGPEVSDIDQLREFMKAGFNSVMVDGSKLPFEENMALTRKVVQLAHASDIAVEGELGHVSRNTDADQEEINKLMTDPDQAARFVEATGVDYLAVSVGSVSGFFKGRIELDLERLSRIRKKVNVPLVFHGGTSIPKDQLKKAISRGVEKVNIAHGMRKAFWDGVTQAAGLPGKAAAAHIDPRMVLNQARDAVKEYVKTKINQLRNTDKSI